MIQASVGFQCPNCAGRSTQQVIRPAQSWARGAGLERPPVTMTLIALNVAVYLLVSLRPQWSLDGELIGRIVVPGVIELGVGQGEWWRLFTGGFMHASPMHLAFNMFALWSIGGALEQTFGAKRFAAVYMACLLSGSFGVMLVSPGQRTVGASGAVFGLFGVLLALQLSRGIPLGQTRLGMVLAINLAFTFMARGISIGGHIGGLIGGIILGVAWFGPPRARREPAPARSWAITIGFGVAVLLGAIAAASVAPAI